MDIIGNNMVNVSGGLQQSSPETTVQRVSWTTTGNGYAMNSGLTSSGGFSDSEQDLNLKASDMTGVTTDGYVPQIYIQGQSRGTKFTATVNWGDGTEEVYESASIYYRKDYFKSTGELYSTSSQNLELILFSPMLDDSMRGAIASSNPTVDGRTRYTDWWYCTSDGERYQGIPNHKYADDRQYNVVVTFEGAEIRLFRIATMPDIGWPTIELPYLTTLVYYYLYNRNSIPFSNFTYLRNLTSLTINATYDKITSLPDSLFNMTSLTNLTIYQMPNDGTGYRDYWTELNMSRISRMVNLTSLTLRNFYLYYYPEELQDLKLTSVVFGSVHSYTTYPNRTTDFSRITKFTSSSSTINITEGTNWNCDRVLDAQAIEEVYSNYLGNITQDVSNVRFAGTGYVAGNFRTGSYSDLEYPEIPEWFDRFYEERTFFSSKNFYGQTQTDTLTERIYEATVKHPMSSTEDGHRNPWYGQTVSAADAIYTNRRPSGTLQAPEGFIEGESNGNPASPLEMIYVLTHNYGQTWNIIAETSTASTASTLDIKAGTHVAGYGLYRNEEGEYILVSPGSELVAKVNENNLIEFDTVDEIRNYMTDNDITPVNKLKGVNDDESEF